MWKPRVSDASAPNTQEDIGSASIWGLTLKVIDSATGHRHDPCHAPASSDNRHGKLL
jgi:hypothetical protein